MLPLASLFPPSTLTTIVYLLFATTSPNNRYQKNNDIYKPVLEARDKATTLTLEGKHKEAVMWYEDAIWAGRRLVLQNTKDDDGDDDGLALELLVELYQSSAWNRLSIPDVDGARREAWAACVHSQNLFAGADGGDDNDVSITSSKKIKVGSQFVLAAVCRAGDDPIGEKEALKNLLQLVAVAACCG